MRLRWEPQIPDNTYIRKLGRAIYAGREITRWQRRNRPKWKYSLDGCPIVFSSLKAVIRTIGIANLPSPGVCLCGGKGSWLLRYVVYTRTDSGVTIVWSGCSSPKHRGELLVPVTEDIYFQAITTGIVPVNTFEHRLEQRRKEWSDGRTK